MKNQKSKIKNQNYNSKVKSFFFLLSLCCCIIVGRGEARAQEIAFPRQYFSISPIISDLTIAPGKETRVDLRIQNLSSGPVGIHAQVSDIEEPDSQNSGSTSPLIKWTTLSENDFIVDAKGEKRISVRITPPKNIKEGGYYEAIYFTPIIGGQNQSQKPVILSRIGALIFATNGKIDYKNLKDKVRIKAFGPSGFFHNEKELSMNLEIENEYFTHFTAKPAVRLEQIFVGRKELSFEEKKILPGRARLWEQDERLGTWGVYKATLALSVGNGEQIFADSWFVYLPYKVLLFVITALMLVLGRNRLKKALKALSGRS